MPVFKLPLSGDVVQSINPWTSFFSPSGGQYGLVNINLGQSSEPKVEADVLSDVASYGKQLGRIGDALEVLLKHVKLDDLGEAEQRTLDILRGQLAGVEEVKERARRSAPTSASEEGRTQAGGR